MNGQTAQIHACRIIFVEMPSEVVIHFQVRYDRLHQPVITHEEEVVAFETFTHSSCVMMYTYMNWCLYFMAPSLKR